MRQNFGLAGVCLCVSLLVSVACVAATAAPAGGLRYFLQPEDVAGSPTPYGNNAVAARSVRSGDANIYYEVYGEGAPIFVFHGGGVGSPYELGKIIDELRKRYMVVVVSSRGHGRSEIGHSPMTLRQKAGDMLAVMEKITTRPAPHAGHAAFLDNYPVAWAAISQFLAAPLGELEQEGAQKQGA